MLHCNHQRCVSIPERLLILRKDTCLTGHPFEYLLELHVSATSSAIPHSDKHLRELTVLIECQRSLTFSILGVPESLLVRVNKYESLYELFLFSQHSVMEHVLASGVRLYDT